MPVLPVWMIGAVVCTLLFLLAQGTRDLIKKRLPIRSIIILACLRVAIVGVFALCLFQPIVAVLRTFEEAAPLLVLLDTSKSMGLSDPGAANSRLSAALREMEQSGLKEALSKRVNVHWFAFDSRARAIDPLLLRSQVPNGSTTRYSESLSHAWELCRQKQGENAPVAAGGRVLLISDGHDRGSRDVAETSREFGLKIDTPAPGPRSAEGNPTTLRITSVQAPRRVLLGAESRFSIALRQTGLAGKQLTLELKEGGKTIARQPVAFSNAEEEKSVNIAFRPEEAGLREYTISVPNTGSAGIEKMRMERTPDPQGDTLAHNFSVQVSGTRNEVLFLEDTWRWEFKFLKRIFEDDPSFTLTAFLSRGQNAFVQLGEPERRTQVTGFPQTRSELGGFDTLVLGSVDPRRWPRGFADALRGLVEEDGKSLVVIAGPNLREMAQLSVLVELLPVELSPESAFPAPGPVAVRVTPEGLASPFFAGQESSPTALWTHLPPMDHLFPVLRKKPGATVLAEAESLRNSYGGLILAAEHTVGRGRILFIGSDTLWKWHMQASNTEGPTPYQIFWQQALRTLAPVRQSVGNVTLFLTPEKSRYATGQTITVRAEVSAGGHSPNQRLLGQAALPDGKQLPLDFFPDSAHPGFFTARFGAELPGQHKISAALSIDEKPAAETLIGVDVEEHSSETAATHIDEANLLRLSRDTGGSQIHWSQPDTWRHLSEAKKVPVPRSVTLDLWNSFALLGVLVLLLGADWLLRLR
jgi:hypothetical protein